MAHAACAPVIARGRLIITGRLQLMRQSLGSSIGWSLDTNMEGGVWCAASWLAFSRASLVESCFWGLGVDWLCGSSR
jgi:hypothetical protein